MGGNPVDDSMYVAGFNRDRDFIRYDAAKQHIGEVIAATRRLIGTSDWLPSAIHLDVSIDGDVPILKSVLLIPTVHDDVFAFCEYPGENPSIAFLSARNPIALKVQPATQGHQRSVAVTLAFSDGRESITLSANNHNAIEKLEWIIREHLLPLFDPPSP